MGFLDQGNNNGYYKVYASEFRGNYAVFVSQDFTVITCERTDLVTGIYNFEGVEEKDGKIIDTVEQIYGMSVSFQQHTVLSDFIEFHINHIQHKNFTKIKNLPKLTKSLITGMDNLNMAAVISCVSDVEFYGFGFTEPLMSALEDYDLYMMSPSRFYIASSFENRYNRNNVFVHFENLPNAEFYAIVANAAKNPDKFALCGGIEKKKFFEFQSESVELE